MARWDGGPAKSETPPSPFRGVGGAVDYGGAGHRLSPGETRSLEAGVRGLFKLGSAFQTSRTQNSDSDVPV